MMATGVIYVAAAGNNQRLGVGADDRSKLYIR